MEHWKELTEEYDLSLSDHSLALAVFENSFQKEPNGPKAVREAALDLIFLASIENRPALFGSTLDIAKSFLGKRLRRSEIKPIIRLLFAGFEENWRTSEEAYAKFLVLSPSPFSTSLRRYRHVTESHEKLQEDDETIAEVAKKRYQFINPENPLLPSFKSSLTLCKKSTDHIEGEYRISLAVPNCFIHQTQLTLEEFRRAIRRVQQTSDTVEDFKERTALFAAGKPEEKKQLLPIKNVEKLMGRRKLKDPEVEAITEDLFHLILYSALTHVKWDNFNTQSLKHLKAIGDKIERLFLSWILKAPTSKAENLRHNFIQIAEKAKSRGNYQLLYSCIAPLMNHSVTRLGLGIDDHPLCQLFAIAKHFHEYHKTILASEEPIMPWISPILQELTIAGDVESESIGKIKNNAQMYFEALQLCYPEYKEIPYLCSWSNTDLRDQLRYDEKEFLPVPKKLNPKDWEKLSFGSKAHTLSVIKNRNRPALSEGGSPRNKNDL